MGEIWIKEAERLGGGKIGGDMDSPSSPGRVVWHTTESGHGDVSFKNVGDYLTRIGAEPHILYDPTTDRLGQYGPLNQSARALRNDGLTRTNRTGRVCIQVEVLARASKPFTGYWKPGPNFKALMRAIRSWDVPDVFPAGALAGSYGANVSRNRTTWATKGGHYGHCNAPGNDHWDPGQIDKAALFAAAPKPSVPTTPPAPSTPKYQPFPGAAWFVKGRKHKLVAAMHDRLVAVGCNRYASSRDKDVIGSGDEASYEAWQRKCGFIGSAASWPPGKTTWDLLKVPYVGTVK
ncbi:peptidoglycan-binding protein [Streptomyces scabiei]|uniref:peptidoglycan-binding protein n=1 Tax=Streptomyces scabiei TaxID=1930 RepID=UPI0029BB85C4|nr:peptidoglycan-binding protein [Streptomyces scabiei]MDX2794007.1 peptidoglycan-binding protein [Streptomyces scabiei]